jgi:hypothetical protein
MDDTLLTVGHTANALGLSAERVRQLADEQQLPCLRASFGWRLFRAADVQEFAARRRAEGFTRSRPRPALRQRTR